MTPTTLNIDHILEAGQLQEEFDVIVKEQGGDGNNPKVRNLILSRLKEVQSNGRSEIEKMLLDDGAGRRCSERLSALQDLIIQAIYDFARSHIYRNENPSKGERIAVIAVGGYGRGTLAPQSDVDLLFVWPYKKTPWGEQMIEYILYLLWDLGLKVGHSTRSLDECIHHAREDITVRTSILEARHVWGDIELFEHLQDRFDKEIVVGTGAEFIAEKLAERDERHDRQGNSRYMVEPNVKEGKGGQRDLNTLFWIGKYFYRVPNGVDLVDKGVYSRRQLNKFRKAQDFLWAVRCHLHFLTKRPDDRLTFDVQQEIAARLGYKDHPGMRAVERFMKHYFLVAKDVGDLTRIFSAALEEQHVKSAPRISRFFEKIVPFKKKRMQSIKGTKDFLAVNGRIVAANDEVFKKDPVNLVRIFYLLDTQNLDMHPELLKCIRRSLRLITDDLRQNIQANRLFIKILTSRSDPEAVLRAMSEAGVLGRFLPEFGKVIAMMQFSMYHHYTVDEHLLRSVGILSEIERGLGEDDHPLSTDLIKTIPSRKVLYVAMLLHDIAKGRPEDHSIEGASIARTICPRLGLSVSETDTVAWLIEYHLEMSTIAQSRDLNDPQTIKDFCNKVQSLERLKLLLILTVADIRAVGPKVFNGWKGQLLRTLYFESETVLSGGHGQLTNKEKVEQSKRELSTTLEALQWSDEDIESCLSRHYDAYWLRVDLNRKIQHATMIREMEQKGELLSTLIKPHTFEAVTEITVVAPDHPRLLSIIAHACFASGANIVDAQIDTTTSGLAVDTIFIRRELPEDKDEKRRGERIGSHIKLALQGSAPKISRTQIKQATNHRSKAFELDTTVHASNSWSHDYTVLEVIGLDRPGLLFDLTKAISSLNLNIASAHVVTFGERAVDVFYVTDLTGGKVSNVGRQETIRSTLIKAFEGQTNTEKPKKVRRRPKRLAS
ncbi:[protein-PII] uridylyltransferase [Flexibacterium corallicola]|uniref:[protein-PII] uridylyltransferase n=1 Tax=Flexibacterium corallicola TaxID=3037259 RepID=UPI00286ED5C7|nr:[protein-PII] uridylyltransferase [Pseudovibrio sp. M1P-2-3]